MAAEINKILIFSVKNLESKHKKEDFAELKMADEKKKIQGFKQKTTSKITWRNW